MSDKLWLWKNFVDGRPEYWAFDFAFPMYMDSDDPQTLGEPCGYAIWKPSRPARRDVSEAEVLRRIASVAATLPDCRTCENLRQTHAGGYVSNHCHNNEHWRKKCVEGDQYQPLPTVRLWRTT